MGWFGISSGFKRRKIPIEARIVAIADVFDALTNKRPYKPEWSVEQAIEYMLEQRGKHFDPKLLSLFIENMPSILEIKAKFADQN